MDISRIDEIIALCQTQQEKQNSPAALVSFRVPRKAVRRSVRLFGDRGPFGVVVQTSNIGSVARFPADKVIDFLQRERKLTLSRQINAAKGMVNGN